MYRALMSFTGIISMSMGEVREISDQAIAQDLLKVGYIEDLSEKPTEEKKETKPRKRKGKANEN